MRLLLLLCFTVSLFVQQLAQAKPAQKIIALSPHSVEMLYAIGAGDRIIATLEYSDYPEDALKIPRIGNYTGIQIEKLIELQPDLIIGWKSGNKAADLKKIESLGFNIFYSHPQNIDDITLEVIKLGELTGLQENAEAVSTEISTKYHALKKYYQQYSKVRVFYQLWHDPLRTIGSDNWNESLINDCNGVNVFHDASTPYPTVSLEDVLSKNPEVIIIPHHSGKASAKEQVWQKWKNIDAVKNNRIRILDGDLINRFGPRAVEGLQGLCLAINSARNL